MNLRAIVLGWLRQSRGRRVALKFVVSAAVLSALVVSIASLALAATAGFPDVATSHPYFAAITDLASQGIIGGFADGTFGPDKPVTRQQFAKMIVIAIGYPVDETDVCPFVDVQISGPGSLYPDNYVAAAAALGITQGVDGRGIPGRAGYVPATKFAPGKNITRYQVTTMVVRMAHTLQPGFLVAPPTGWAGNATWAASPIHGANAALAECNGLLAGLDLDTLDPTGDMSRAEVAQVLYNLVGPSLPATVTTQPAITTTTDPSGTTGAIDITIPAEIEGTWPIWFGETISGTLAVFDQLDLYSFAGNAGDRVLIRLVRASGTIWMGLGLYLPGGEPLEGLYDVPTAEIPGYTLPYTGFYVVSVNEGYDGQDTGDYCLYLQRLNNPANATPVVYGERVNGSIESEAQMDTYTFQGTAGEKVDVRMTQLTGIMWPGVRIYGPDGIMLAEQRSPHVAETATVELPSTGSYTVLAFDGWYGFRLGTYELMVTRQ